MPENICQICFAKWVQVHDWTIQTFCNSKSSVMKSPSISRSIREELSGDAGHAVIRERRLRLKSRSAAEHRQWNCCWDTAEYNLSKSPLCRVIQYAEYCGKKLCRAMLQWHRSADKKPYDNILEICEIDFDINQTVGKFDYWIINVFSIIILFAAYNEIIK